MKIKNKINFLIIAFTLLLTPCIASADLVDFADCPDTCNTFCTEPIYCDLDQEGDITTCKANCESTCNGPYGIEESELQTQTYTDCENMIATNDSILDSVGDDDDDDDSTSMTITTDNPLGGTMDPRQIISNVVSVVLIFLGVITLIVFIIAGMMMMFSGGNEELFKKSRTMMIWAVIGLAITLSSYAILSFLFSQLT